ncbi:MAG TPA: phosphate ABC transporter substrate-binding protein PstS [Solirubrobacterales bacterium]|nr:phosphate ABC transporter substrate-binding protein PstS [Solirubrobacterales bacterium]
MSKRLLSAFVAALALAIGVAACGGSSSTGASSGSGGGSNSPLVGAGSTLVAPLMSKWQSDFSSKKEITVTYGAIGSGGGIEQITSRTVDFGASDAPLTEEQFEEADAQGEVEQIPWALSGTVPAYNVQGAPKDLKLSGEVLADIYLGEIASWDDPAIAKLNPGASLPSTKITPVYRSDGSGDTYAFTNYLSTIDPEFSSKVGTSTSVKFPTGVGAEKNDGVSAAISQTDGAIGYVGLAYALSNELSMPLVENSAGEFPEPGVKSVEAAADAVSEIGPNNEISLAKLPASAKGAYPISTYTYVIVPLESEKAEEMKTFITYAITEGQSYGPDLDFAPLPKQVVAAGKKAIAKIGS